MLYESIDLKQRAHNGKSAPLDLSESLNLLEDLYALTHQQTGEPITLFAVCINNNMKYFKTMTNAAIQAKPKSDLVFLQVLVASIVAVILITTWTAIDKIFGTDG